MYLYELYECWHSKYYNTKALHKYCYYTEYKLTHFLSFLCAYQVIDETLSPTWDELLVFEEVLVYGRREDIKANPPTVIIEIYDQDKVIF